MVWMCLSWLVRLSSCSQRSHGVCLVSVQGRVNIVGWVEIPDGKLLVSEPNWHDMAQALCQALCVLCVTVCTVQRRLSAVMCAHLAAVAEACSTACTVVDVCAATARVHPLLDIKSAV